MAGSQKQTYGKGGSASSKAVLNDNFFDENEIDQQMLKMNLGQSKPSSPLKDDAKPVPPIPSVPLVNESQEAKKDPASMPSVAVRPQAVAYVSPLIAECLKPNSLDEFSAWAERVAGAFKVMKVAEGSYGEVYKLGKREMPPGTAATMTHHDPDAHGGCIFKIVPLRARSSKSNKQTRLEALVREIQMLKCMDSIPGFARFRDLTILQGSYAKSFTEAYYDYKERKGCVSAPPVSYSEKQLWAMIEMDDAGKDLETITTPSAYQIFDIFWMTCCSLVYAEMEVEFEHRDLHVGNICIKSTHPNNALDICPNLNTTMQPDDLRSINFGYSNLRITIIDYTLSRATPETKPNDDDDNNSPPRSPLFDPLKCISIFKQKGRTPEESYQCETYRRMRNHAVEAAEQSHQDDPSRENRKRDKWSRFLPRTNAMWLECLLFTLLFRSKGAVLEGSSEVSSQLQRKLYAGLRRTLRILDGSLGDGEEGVPRSAKYLLVRASREGLVSKEDVEAIEDVWR